MKKNLFILMAVMILSGLSVNAQKIVLKSGSFDFLKDQKVLLAKFDYSDVSVGKFDKEADYIAQKVEEYNKSKPGMGDSWKESWLSDRPTRYEPQFEELFNEYMKPKGISCDRNENSAKYVIEVQTTFIEPGFNVYVTRKNAMINANVRFIEIASGKEMALIEVSNCPGRDAFGNDYDTGLRIQEAYAKLGKSIAGFVGKNL